MDLRLCGSAGPGGILLPICRSRSGDVMSSCPGPGIYDTLLDRAESQGSSGTDAVRPGSGPITMYADYPISRSLQHWVFQSNKALDSPTGQNLVHHTVRGTPSWCFPGIGKRTIAVPCTLKTIFLFRNSFLILDKKWNVSNDRRVDDECAINKSTYCEKSHVLATQT